jgi:hypothetical protein
LKQVEEDRKITEKEFIKNWILFNIK